MSIRRSTTARIDREQAVVGGCPSQTGLGPAALRRFEETAARMGFHRLGLHVFADNEPACSLYRSLGYVQQSVWMGKDLPVAEQPVLPPG